MSAKRDSKSKWLTPRRLVPLSGVFAAVFAAVVFNILAARHFTRWDWTRGKRYTLSAATIETLHDLPETVEVWVLLGSDDPLLLSVKELLVSYESETPHLDVHYVDPDRDAIQLLDVRRRFKIEAARAEDGRVVTDASIVVAHGDRHWFIGASDLVSASTTDDTRMRPREEQALTGAIRNVMSGEKTRLCFTSGHDEMSITDPGPQGAGILRDLLEKDNYDVVQVESKDPDEHEPFKGCAVVVIAGPRAPFSPDEDARLRTYLMMGGNLLAAVSPIGAPTDTGMVPPGIATSLAPFGIALDEDVVIERDTDQIVPDQIGAFTVAAKPHAVTGPLVKEEGSTHEPPRVLLLRPRSMHAVPEPNVNPTPILVTTPQAFGVVSVAGAATWPAEGPEKSAHDLPGPLDVAMASERPKLDAKAPHGPRAVVVGTASILQPLNWAEPIQVRGAAFLVENSISWLATRAAVLDVPEKPAGVGALRISEEARSEIWRYVLFYVPGAAALLGLAVGLRRRSTEGRAWKSGGAKPA